MTILDSGEITTQQPGAFFDVSLRQASFFTQSTDALADNHGQITSQLARGVAVIYRKGWCSVKEMFGVPMPAGARGTSQTFRRASCQSWAIVGWALATTTCK